MKIDLDKLFPNGVVERDSDDFISELLLTKEEMPEVLDALEDLGFVWSTGDKPTDFSPVEEQPDSPYFCLEFFIRPDDGSIRFCYDDYDLSPTGDHSANRFWIEEVLDNDLIRPTPLSLELLLNPEVST